MKNIIYHLALQCQRFYSREMDIQRNKIHQPHIQGVITFTDYDVEGDWDIYLNLAADLCKEVQQDYPQLSFILSGHIHKFKEDPIIHFSGINAIVDTLVEFCKPTHGARRIFISHSSKDKEVVNAFVNNILQLGIGIDYRDIFCTSIEELGVRNGQDIRKHIHENIKSADYSFLMISDNYKASEICLNEMGAVWAYDANIRFYILPNSDFDKIGWLCEPQKADKINDATALDNLFNEMTSFYSLPKDFEKWSGQRKVFMDYFIRIK